MGLREVSSFSRSAGNLILSNVQAAYVALPLSVVAPSPWMVKLVGQTIDSKATSYSRTIPSHDVVSGAASVLGGRLCWGEGQREQPSYA